MGIERHFRTRKSAKRSIAMCYFFGVGYLFIVALEYRHYLKYGRIAIPVEFPYSFPFYGTDALLVMVSTIVVSTVLVGYGVYLNALYIRYKRMGEFDKERVVPEYVMCSKCLEPYDGTAIENHRCPKCGSTAENTEGFYKRHPESK